MDEKVLVEWVAHELGSSGLRGGDSRWSAPIGAAEGDDCAVVSIGGVDLVIGTDYVRGPKFSMFEAGELSCRDLGRFLAVANASDIAAMGADPWGMLVVVRYSKDMTEGDFHEVMYGVDEVCAAHGFRLLGGDTGSAERLILSA